MWFRKEGEHPPLIKRSGFVAGAIFLALAPLCFRCSDVGTPEIAASAVRPPNATDAPCHAAERAFSRAADLAARPAGPSQREAIALYRTASDAWRQCGDRPREAGALLAAGQLRYEFGETEAAEADYERARAISKEAGDQRLAIRAYNELGYARIYASDYPAALEYCNRALEMSSRLQDRAGEAQALLNFSEYNYLQGDREKALDQAQKALSLWSALGDQRGQAKAHLQIGYAYAGLNQGPNATAAYSSALRLWESLRDRAGEAQTLTAIGDSYSSDGDRQKALGLYQRALEIYAPLGGRLGEAMTLNSIGYVYDEMGDYLSAIRYYDKARTLYRKLNTPVGEAGQMMKMGEMYFLLGKGREALKFLTESLALNRRIANKRVLSCNLNDLGWVHESGGLRQKALGYYRQSLDLNRETKDIRAEAYTLNYIGRMHAESGRAARARHYFREALGLNQAAADREGESLTRYHLALAASRLGDLGEARRQIEASLEISESLRTKVAGDDLRISYLATTRPRYDFQIDLLMRIAHRERDREFEALALRASERARARGLLDLLAEAHAQIQTGISPGLLDRQFALDRQLKETIDQQMAMRAAGEAESEEFKEKLAALLTDRRQLDASIKAESPRYAALTTPQPVKIEDLQKNVLDDETLLLEYALGDKRSYLWAVTPKGLTSYVLPGRTVIEKTADEMFRQLTARQSRTMDAALDRDRVAKADIEYRRLSMALSEMLLRPVAGLLGNKRLLVVTEGALQRVPFAALPEPRAGGYRPLIAGHEIVTQPSASMLALLRKETAPRRYSKSVAVLADPIFTEDDGRLSMFPSVLAGILPAAALPPIPRNVPVLRSPGRTAFNLDRLPAAEIEADAIISLAPPGSSRKAVGAEATRELVMSGELSKYRIVHFATHGMLNPDNPELSAIALSHFDRHGRPCDGLLRLHDIYNLTLPVELVVLSACETALGKDVKGEGLMAMTRGFMYAGASRVVASLWKVDDDASAELMRGFYANLFEKRMTPPAALAAAQRNLSQRRQWAAPYYWAAFTIQGEYR
ncbi:MAG: CHAT domain-containing protein [Blastocatellia bacterium]